MFHHEHVLVKYYAKAVNTTIHFRVRCPDKAIMNATPKELWSGRKPTVKHFKVFGCLAYALKLELTRKSKLEPKSTKHVFLWVMVQIPRCTN
jgi:hypothetical protein